jgi:molybdate transport system ATP-binding protein
VLQVKIRKALPGFTLEVDFSINQEILAILGPSGSGKTMTLKCIAGLLQPDGGHIELNGKVLFDSVAHINLPPQQRKVGFVFQNYALFPHLTVDENTAYGIHHKSKDEVNTRVSWLLDKMGIQGLRQRYPRQLSSGQQQRAALARALSQDPEVLLLDEPFSALDSMRKERLEFELLALHDFYKGDMLFVTHDLAQGYKLGSRIGVYEAGHMVQCDSKQNVILSPTNRTVARLTGVKNLMEAEITRIQDLNVWVTIPELGEVMRVAPKDSAKLEIGQHVLIGIRPEYVKIVEQPGENTLLGTVDGLMEEVAFLNVRFQVHAKIADKHWIEVGLPQSDISGLQNGQVCYLHLPPERLIIISG